MPSHRPAKRDKATRALRVLSLWLAVSPDASVDWKRFTEQLHDHYGASTLSPAPGTRPFTIQLQFPEESLPKLLADAEGGVLDALAGQVGARFVQEIREGAQCLYNYLPPTLPSSRPEFTDVDTSRLKSLLSQVDVVVLTTTPIERAALYAVMKPLPRRKNLVEGAIKHVTYRLGRLGRYFVAHAESTMGSLAPHGSTLTVNDAIAELAPKAVLILGIAFGIDPAKQRLGDVLVAESVVLYELQRVGKKVVPRGEPLRCGPLLSERFRTRSQDWKLERGEDTVKLFPGPMLSGEKLVARLEFRDSLIQMCPRAVGGEMEGAGAYSATTRAGVEVILLKAICDWGDESKTDRAQPFAARAAVSLAHHVLSKKDVLAPLGARDHEPPKAPVTPKPRHVPVKPLPPPRSEALEERPHPNPKRAPSSLYLGESGLREADASFAVVGGILVQRPEELENGLRNVLDDLLHLPFLPRTEKERLQRQGFVPGTDDPITREKMLSFLTTADFDLFAMFVSKAQRQVSEEQLREELVTKFLRDRLPARKFPVDMIFGHHSQYPTLLETVSEGLREKPWSDVSTPGFRKPPRQDFCLMVAEYVCAVLRSHLERAPALVGTPDPALDRFRMKLRMVVDLATGEQYHRGHPLP